jgi:hypothetical protein
LVVAVVGWLSWAGLDGVGSTAQAQEDEAITMQAMHTAGINRRVEDDVYYTPTLVCLLVRFFAPLLTGPCSQSNFGFLPPLLH